VRKFSCAGASLRATILAIALLRSTLRLRARSRLDPGMSPTTSNRALSIGLLLALPLVVAGCWTAPVANVQPKGEPRLIQDSIAVESVKNPAIVQSVDASARSVLVQPLGEPTTIAYQAGPKVENFDRIKIGDKVQAKVTERLSIYVSRDGKVPGPSGALEAITSDAKVLMVDPSYRLLTVQYPNGQRETFKVALNVRLREMEAGDDVVVRSLEAVELKVL
jgi:hypothetical protein